MYSMKMPLSLVVLPVIAGILCTAAFFFKHFFVCSQISLVLSLLLLRSAYVYCRTLNKMNCSILIMIITVN